MARCAGTRISARISRDRECSPTRLPDISPAAPRPLPLRVLLLPLPFFALPVPVAAAELRYVDETHHEVLAALPLTSIEQFVHERLSASSAMQQQVFEIDEPAHVELHLEVAPAGELARFALREEALSLCELEPLARAGHH